MIADGKRSPRGSSPAAPKWWSPSQYDDFTQGCSARSALSEGGAPDTASDVPEGHNMNSRRREPTEKRTKHIRPLRGRTVPNQPAVGFTHGYSRWAASRPPCPVATHDPPCWRRPVDFELTGGKIFGVFLSKRTPCNCRFLDLQR